MLEPVDCAAHVRGAHAESTQLFPQRCLLLLSHTKPDSFKKPEYAVSVDGANGHALQEVFQHIPSHLSQEQHTNLVFVGARIRCSVFGWSQWPPRAER